MTGNRPSLLAAVAALLAVAAAGCRQDMHDAPKIEPLEASTFFADGQGARPIPEGTVARGQLREDSHFFTGRDDSGALVTTFPMPVDRALLLRGQARYEIFCSPCHDSTGSGNGMIVRRGFKQPPPYTEARLLEMPVGYFFDVVTNGYGTMSGYARQVPAADRWAIVAYLEALKVSQASPLASLPAPVVEAFHQALAADHQEPAAADHH